MADGGRALLLQDVRAILIRIERELAAECEGAGPGGLLDAIAAAVGARWFTSAELLEHAQGSAPDLARVLETHAPKRTAKAVGWALRRTESAPHASLALERAAENGAAVWRVVSLAS